MTTTTPWQLAPVNLPLTDDMGSPVMVARAKRGAAISYSDTGEPAISLRRAQIVYIENRPYDVLASENNVFVRERYLAEAY